VDALAQNFLKNRELTPDGLLGDLAQGLDYQARLNLSALVTWRASRLSRISVLEAINPDRLTVYGDSAWKALLPKARCAGRVNYGRELAKTYQRSAINLNITSAQMKNGLNQRVFDCPLSGNFLLTDARSQLAGLLEPGREIVIYNSPKECQELCYWYLKRPEARRSIILAGQSAIKERHLYRHRVSELVAKALG
jgi:spore maturation protein CgeB